ncbi:glycosyltransferase family 4 protein [Effusibacillus lacus]|nr:glycosyltransferase [Effusibacillus lacus]
MMLYKLLSGMDRRKFDQAVISLIDEGTLGERIKALGIPVHSVGMKSGVPSLGALWKLMRTVRRLNPDLIQGWMYHGNLAAQLSALFFLKRIPVIWNIRQSLYSLKDEKPTTAAVIKLSAKMSRFPVRIVNNSSASAEHHEKIGFCRNKRVIIPNGFDVDRFFPTQEVGNKIRIELGVSDQSIMIGLIARYHPMKDHLNFLQAAKMLLQDMENVEFVLVGTNVDRKNSELMQQMDKIGKKEKFHLLGERSDIAEIIGALDIAVSSSIAEGFPNVVGEAMSCGVPCVVTDVGDSAWIVSNTGRVVPPQNPLALAAACKELIEMGAEQRRELGRKARKRIEECFSLSSIVREYELLYEHILNIRKKEE